MSAKSADRPPRFGVIYSRLHPVISPSRFAGDVEQMGYHSVWTTEGLANQKAALDPIVTMGALVHGSENIRVGSAVVLLPLRNPAILAKEVASLDVLSGGRITLGVGVGGSSLSNPADFRACGVDPRERGARCDEALDVMAALWRGEPVSHHGRFWSFDDISLEPAPLQQPHPPIWAGGNVEGVLRRAGRVCDGFVPMAMGADEYQRLWARVRDHAEASQRDPTPITRALHIHCGMGQDRPSATRMVEQVLTERYGIPVSLPHPDQSLAGDADDCCRTIDRYLEAGVEYFVINTTREIAAVPGAVEQFATEVMSRYC